MSMPLSERTQRALAERRDQYVASLPSRADQLESLARSNDRAGLYDAVHKLAGSAGLYELPEVQKVAHDLQLQLREGVEVEQLATQIQALNLLLRGAS